MVSLIIPTSNEEHDIGELLDHLRHVRGDFEVLVVDGASTDETPKRVEALIPSFPRPLRLLTTERNRAIQLNRAAELALGDTLLFLHADARPAEDAVHCLEAALKQDSIVGGNFDLVYQGDSGWSRFFTWVNRQRRAFGIYYGDSALFVRRAVFTRLRGFQPVPIMDDYEFIRRMERYGRTLCLPSRVFVSDRRWQVQGVFRTVLSWVWIQALYSLGVPPKYLAWWYPPVRKGKKGEPRARPRERQVVAPGNAEPRTANAPRS